MITVCYGLPGMGKTTWLHDYIRAHSDTHLFFVVDRAAEWGPDAAHWRGNPPKVCRVFEKGDELLEEWPPAGVMVLRGREGREVAALVVGVGNATYVDDELDFSGSKRGWEDNPLRVIVHQGRHAENAKGEFTQVNILGACRRPQSLHTDITDIVDQVCIFKVQGTRTLERLTQDSMIEDRCLHCGESKSMGEHGKGEGQHRYTSDWDTIRTLKKWHYLHWPSGNWEKVKPLPEKKEDGKKQ